MKKNMFKFACKECGKEFKGNEKLSNKNWRVCTKDDKCDCGGEYEIVLND